MLEYIKIRKNTVMKIIGIFCISIFFIICANSSYARSYNIAEYDVIVDVKDDGSLNITEEITYDFDGKFNGVYRDFYYKTDTDSQGIYPKSSIYMGSGISNIKTSVYNNTTSSYRDINEKDVNGEYVETTSYNNGTGIKLYSASNDERKKFKFEYTVRNVVTSHNDVSEIYWNFLNDEEAIKKANVKIIFPRELDGENIYVFPHHQAKNVNFFIIENEINIVAENIKGDTYLDARVVFPKNTLPDISKVTGENKLDDILFLEKNLDKPTEILNIKIGVMAGGAILTILTLIFAMINYKKVFEKYDREYDVQKNKPARFEIPSRSKSPFEVSYLVNNGLVQNKDLIAVILDLVDRKYIQMDTIKELTKKGKEKYKYLLSKSTENDANDLKQFEKEIYDYIFNEEIEKVDLDEKLKSIETSPKEYEKFGKIALDAGKILEKEMFEFPKQQKGEFKIWPTIISIIIMIAVIIIAIIIPESYGYSSQMSIDNNITNYLPIIMIASFVAVFIGIIGITIYKSTNKFSSLLISVIIIIATAGIIGANMVMISEVAAVIKIAKIALCLITGITIINIILLIASHAFKRMKKEYAEQREDWLALKKYIEDYSYLNDKEAAHVINWGPYMVYASAFGIADKLNKELNIMYQETGIVAPNYMSYCAISIALNSRITTANNISGGGSGGFSGGGGGGRRKFWRSILKI